MKQIFTESSYRVSSCRPPLLSVKRTHLGVHALHLVLLQLELHKVVDDVEQLGGDGLKELVVVVFNGERGEDSVVDERRA